MQKEERVALLALCAVPGIGGKTVRTLGDQLCKRGARWTDFWESSAAALKEIGAPERIACAVKKFQTEYTPASFSEYLAEREIFPVLEQDCNYPALLREVDSRPAVLFTRGSLTPATQTPIAVVGTRRVTTYGKLATKRIVTDLVLAGATVISGFMYGVDALAHQQAVLLGGKTVGVLGFGFDHMFPKSIEHSKLFSEILESGGAFVTEFPPATPARAGNFPARNRIVAGMSLGVVVVEAALKSGSHITAGFAADEGRVVCAVPGPITSEYSLGTKQLINDGAVLVTTGQDVLQELGACMSTEPPDAATTATSGVTQLQRAILDQLQLQSLSANELSERLPYSSAEIQYEITLLELRGVITRHGAELMLI